MGRKRKPVINDNIERETVRLTKYYQMLALNRYKWENLPNGIESRYIEQMLFDNGECAMFDHPDLGLCVLRSSSRENLNIYGEPTKLTLTGFNEHRTVMMDECVRMMNNDLALPSLPDIVYYARRMAEIDDIIMQNLRQQRVPYLFATDENNSFSMKALYDRIYQGEPAIFVDKEMLKGEPENIMVIPTTSPYLVDKLQLQKQEMERELLTFLGINNTLEKKERLLVDETNSNNQFIKMASDIGFKQRQLACEQMNEMFGLNVRVIETQDEFESEVMADGELHHGNPRDDE
nr:MAG TPA: upper collar protein [Caudoviricetes sp.]